MPIGLHSFFQDFDSCILHITVKRVRCICGRALATTSYIWITEYLNMHPFAQLDFKVTFQQG